MKQKLLNKTLRVYVAFSVAVLLVSAVLFYFLMNRLMAEEADETLLMNHREFVLYIMPVIKSNDIANWNKINRNIKIESASTALHHDSLFNHAYLDTLDNELEPYRVLLAPLTIDGRQYTYRARMNLVETEDVATNIVLLFAVIVGLLLLGLFVLTRQLSKKLWMPFYSTLHFIEQFEVDKNVAPVLTQTDTEEFSRLNNAINNLVERNTSIYKSQHEFIENAAHEMQTPLAVFQAKIDLFIQAPGVTREQSEIFTQLYDAASRLTRLNKNLLLLSKIENNHYAELERISLRNCIEKNLGFFKEQALENAITIQADDASDITIYANLALTETLLGNLIVNATRHNVANGKIQISLSQATLTVSNTGAATPLFPGKLYQRFSKANPSAKGNGLGLAIIKKIVDLYNWQITYTYAGQLHTFSICFEPAC